MRWLFLFLFGLNGLYYVWHQQDAPLRPKEVEPLSTYRTSAKDIRLLSESGASSQAEQSQCLYLGAGISERDARMVEQRLTSLDIHTLFGRRLDDSGDTYWLKIEPDSRRLVDQVLISELARDFPQLKSKIMSCEPIATMH